jgi:hypothetical protein
VGQEGRLRRPERAHSSPYIRQRHLAVFQTWEPSKAVFAIFDFENYRGGSQRAEQGPIIPSHTPALSPRWHIRSICTHPGSKRGEITEISHIRFLGRGSSQSSRRGFKGLGLRV